MSMKSLVVATAVAASTLGFAANADAQVIYTTGSYYTPGVTYSYAPGYFGGSNVIVPASYSTGYYSPYSTSYYSPYNAGYYSASPYSNMYYSGYNNVYNTGPYGFGVGTRGGNFGGRRVWRW